MSNNVPGKISVSPGSITRKLYAAFDEPLLRYACRRFLPPLHTVNTLYFTKQSSFQQIIHRELATIVLDD